MLTSLVLFVSFLALLLCHELHFHGFCCDFEFKIVICYSGLAICLLIQELVNKFPGGISSLVR